MIEGVLPLPSLNAILRFDYHGDECHTMFNTAIDEAYVGFIPWCHTQRYKVYDVVRSLATFNVAHVVSDTTADLPIIVVFAPSHHTQVTAIRHLFACNYYDSPILILSSQASSEEWAECFHTYTPLKVAVLQGRRDSAE